MKKTIVLSLLMSLFVGLVSGQQTLIYTHQDVLFNQGRELFNQRKFAASYRSFEEFLKSVELTKAGQIQEAEYYIAANAFELRQTNAEEKLNNYLFKHPYTPFFDKTIVMLGMLEYENKKYASALTYFGQVNEDRLGQRERVDFMFCKGYASLETKNYVQALAIFKALKNMNSRYNL